ncbi:hypothetical protein N9Y01_01585 [Candidatus Poseidonia alphae]|nr:hypothetical protein [Candidatus Poseidonia alphae]
MPHEVAWHLDGCPCGSGAVQMTPIRYLTECVRPRFENHSHPTTFEKTIRLNPNEVQTSDLVQQWDGMQLPHRHDFDNRREPLVCPYNYPTGISEHEDYLQQIMPAGFFSIKFKSPYAKGYYETEGQRLTKVFRAIDNDFDLKPYIFFGHWHAERDMCPCWNPHDKASYRHVFNSNEEDTTTKNAMILMDNQGSKQLQFGESRPLEDKRSVRAFTRIESTTFPDNVQPSLFVESKRSAHDYTVYEEWLVFGKTEAVGALSFNRKFVLVMPESSVDEIKRFLPPQDDSEIRAWGQSKKDGFPWRHRDTDFFVICGAYNSMARRVFNDISAHYGVEGKFGLRSMLSIHALEWSTGEVLGSTPDGSLFNHNQRRLKLLITNHERGLMQKLYILRVRIHARTRIIVATSSLILEQNHEGETTELIISAKDSSALTLSLSDIPYGITSIDIQELSSSAAEIEYSHASIHLRREHD